MSTAASAFFYFFYPDFLKLRPFRKKNDYVFNVAMVLQHAVSCDVYSNIMLMRERGKRPNEQFVVLDIAASRISIHSDNRIQSFGIPSFSVLHPNEGDSLMLIYDGNSLDSVHLSALLNIMSADDDSFLFDFDELVTGGEIDFGGESLNYDFLRKLLSSFYESDACYFRQDNDEEQSRGREEIHPKHHIDVFFSSHASVKYKLEKPADHTFIHDMVSKETPAHQIVN